ncbi:MAG: hypothetical protein ACW972_10305, partial [Promethearchaeota archaeon]
MKSRYYKSKITLKKINVLIFLLFTLIIPIILNSHLFSNFHKSEPEDFIDETLIPPKLNAPID